MSLKGDINNNSKTSYAPVFYKKSKGGRPMQFEYEQLTAGNTLINLYDAIFGK
jgi:hypothetical protein